MKTKNFFLSLLIFPTLATANIMEISTLSEILPYIHSGEEGALVVFDIDNTLLKSTQHLGSVAWGDFIAQSLENRGISKSEAQEVVSVLWRAVQPKIKVRAVDPNTQSIIREIQSKNIPVMCLTARKPQELENTLCQLQSVGINLSTIFPESLYLTPQTLYCQGILFATPLNKKSQVFISFLNKIHLRPKRVIFIDDKFSHVEDVKESLVSQGIECLGIRFAGADEDVRNFNPSIAEIQWKAFPEPLTDDRARHFLNGRWPMEGRE